MGAGADTLFGSESYCARKEMLPAGRLPIFGGNGAFSQRRVQQVRLWMRMTKMEPSSRAAALVLNVNSVARQVCLSAGGDHLENTDGVSRALEILRNFFAPEAPDSIRQEVARFMQFRRTD